MLAVLGKVNNKCSAVYANIPIYYTEHYTAAYFKQNIHHTIHKHSSSFTEVKHELSIISSPEVSRSPVQAGRQGDEVDNYLVINMINPAPHIQMECLLW